MKTHTNEDTYASGRKIWYCEDEDISCKLVCKYNAVQWGILLEIWQNDFKIHLEYCCPTEI